MCWLRKAGISLCTRQSIGIVIDHLFVQKHRASLAAAPQVRSHWCMVAPSLPRRTHMTFTEAARNDSAVEQCLDELNDLMAGLQRYSPTVLAVALRVHLETLLQALLDGKVCSPEEVRDFVRELERDALQYSED
jgi:hypothetical protein